MKKIFLLIIIFSGIIFSQVERADLFRKNFTKVGNNFYPRSVNYSIMGLDTLQTDFIDTVKTIQFDLLYSDGSAEGRLQWNKDDGTLEFGMPGGNVNLQIGQEQLIRVKNDQGSIIYNGQVVYASGAVGNNPLVKLADNSDMSTAITTIGIATEDIGINQFGFINISGLSRYIPTDTIMAGSVTWLGKNGEFTDERPIAPNIQIALGIVTRSHATEGAIQSRLVLVPRLNYLSDVYVPAIPSTGEILTWNNSYSRYEINNYWDDYRIPLTQGRLGINAKPDFDTTNVAYLFPQNDASEVIYMIAQLPHNWVEGTDLDCHVHWLQENADSITWKIGYKWTDVGELQSTTWSYLTGSILQMPYTSGVLHQRTELGTITGTNHTLSSILQIKLFRTDNVYSGDVKALDFDFHYQVNRIGSINEYNNNSGD